MNTKDLTDETKDIVIREITCPKCSQHLESDCRRPNGRRAAYLHQERVDAYIELYGRPVDELQSVRNRFLFGRQQ